MDRAIEMRATVEFWEKRLAEGPVVTFAKRQVFRQTLHNALVALHPAYLAVIPVGGDKPCAVLNKALRAAQLAPMVLKCGVKTVIRDGVVFAIEHGLTRPVYVAPDRLPAPGRMFAGASQT